MRPIQITFLVCTIVLSASDVPARQSCDGGYALDFEGSTDRVIVPYDASFPTAVFTAAAWIKTVAPQSRAAVIARGEDDNSWNLSWQLYVRNDGTLEVMLENTNDQNFCYPLNNCQPQGSCNTTGSLFVADDTWHHVAVTRDAAGALAMYIDGVEVGACTNTGVPSNDNFQDLSIGCTHGTIGPPPGGIEPPTWFFPGVIDEAAMWNVALSAAEVAEVHATGVDAGSAGLVGYWPFDEGTGQVVADLSPAGNDGFRGEFPAADGADPEWLEQPLPTETYCVAAANSAGGGATMGASGSLSVASNSFVVEVEGAVPGQPGLFFYGVDATQVPFGDGFLCVQPGVYRLNPPLTPDGSGDASRHVDFTVPPTDSGPGEIVVGSTWRFQFWYRDPAAGGAGFNLSDGLAATFCP